MYWHPPDGLIILEVDCGQAFAGLAHAAATQVTISQLSAPKLNK